MSSSSRLPEARHHLVLPALATRPPRRLPYAGLLPWEEAPIDIALLVVLYRLRDKLSLRDFSVVPYTPADLQQWMVGQAVGRHD